MRTISLVVLAALIGLTALGCASEGVKDINARVMNNLDRLAKKEPNAVYVIDPPDSFSVQSADHPELSTSVVVRQDGFVTLPLLNDVYVQGMTPLEVKAKLEKLYSEYYRDISLLVTVTGFNSKKVYVYGEVPRNGSLPYTGEQTVMDLIGQVGGVTHRAAARRAYVIRSGLDGKEKFKVDLVELVVRGDVTQNVYLAEDDVLYVPPTVMAWIGYQIEQVLFPFTSIFHAATTYETARDLGNNNNN